LCFIVALFYSYSFSSYSGERFTQLYDGIKKFGVGNYAHRLDFDGTDKFYEISLVVNEMAGKLSEYEKKISSSKPTDSENNTATNNMRELKSVLTRIRNIETEAEVLIAKLEDQS
jgi:hypothetical protein